MWKLLLVSALLCCSTSLLAAEIASAQQPAATPDAAAAAKLAAKSKVVANAPEADLENGNDDIDVAAGKCKDIFKSACKDVEAGEGKAAQCITDLIDEMESAADSKPATSVSEECQEEVFQYFIKRNKNINKNVPLARACKADAEKLCNNTWLFGSKDGTVIACLKENKAKLSAKCKAEVYRVQRQAANDFRSDARMEQACAGDAKTVCADVKPGGGRIQACLRDNRFKISWECQEQLFTQEEEADDDIRLSVRLFNKCLPDKKRFCGDVEPGAGAAKQCLIDNRDQKEFSAACRDELDAMIERRVQDFRLDSRLRRTCQKDMYELCGLLDGMFGDEVDISLCLQDYVNEIQDDGCRSMVKKYQELAAEDIRFDVPLAEACAEDRQKLCGSVPPGSARVIRCLQKDRTKLSAQCRAVLFDEEIRFSENIDFQYPMKKACEKEIDTFCRGIPHGNARVIRCLQDKKKEKEFGKACLEEVRAYEQQASQDYRLNYRLRTACKTDISTLCKDACKVNTEQLCGGTVLRCLTDKRDDIKSQSCKNEVFYYMKMEVQDFHNDVILAAACREDVAKFCKDAPQGDGRVHACLRKHSKQLSDACRREELILEQQESEHIELKPGVLQACKDERAMFCQGVRPGSARVFRCLAEKLADPDFGQSCRSEIITKLKRRQANWKLDPPLRKACKADVADMCKEEDSKGSEEGLVYKCLIKNQEDLDPGCKKELGRAIHMAFFVWGPEGKLTAPCDADVKRLCLAKRPNMDAQPGEVGKCMSDIIEQVHEAESVAGRKDLKDPANDKVPQLSEECRAIADVAEPPNMKRAFETSLSLALLESSLGGVEGTTGLKMVARDRQGAAQGLTLTGWTALLGMAALVILVIVGATWGYKQYYGIPDSNTVVLKSKPHYARVATNSD